MAQFFFSDAAGNWKVGAESIDPACNELRNPFCAYEASGINGVWTKVPAVSTLVHLLAASGLLGILARGPASSEELRTLPYGVAAVWSSWGGAGPGVSGPGANLRWAEDGPIDTSAQGISSGQGFLARSGS